MNRFLFIITATLFYSFGFAQQDKPSAIEKYIKEVNMQVEDCMNNEAEYESSAICYHEVKLNYMLPAVGNHFVHTRFFYESIQTDAEINPYKFHYRLLKIVKTFNVGYSVSHREEYIYRGNELVWSAIIKTIKDSENKECEEYNNAFLFEKGKLLQLDEHRVAYCEGKSHPTIRLNSFTKQDYKTASNIQQEAQQLKMLFDKFSYSSKPIKKSSN